MTVYVQKQTGRVNAAGADRTWTQSTRPLDGLPPDTSSRILDPGNFERHAFGRGQVLGGPQTDFGIAVWDNTDHALDDLQLASVDGEAMELYLGPDTATTFRELSLYLRGTTARVTYDGRSARLTLRNRQGEIAELPLQVERYAGDNALPDGVEGVETDLKDAYKPIWLGFNENVTVPVVNTSKHICQLSAAEAIPITGNAPSQVWVNGAELTATKVQQIDWSVFTGTTGPSGQLWWYSGPEGWFIRLQSSPEGTVTVTAQEGTSADTTTAQLVRRILIAKGVSPSDIDGVDDLDGRSPETVGYVTPLTEITVGTALADILAGIIGTWTDDRLGRFTLARLEEPAAQPDHIFDAAQILRSGDDEGFRILAQDGVGEPGTPVPLSEAVVLYRRNWTVQGGGDLAGIAVSTEHGGFVGEAYRRVTIVNTNVEKQYPTARPFEFPTLFSTTAQAAAAGNRFVRLFGRRRFLVEIDLTTEQAAAVRLLDTVLIPIGRFDWDTRPFLVIGIVDDLDTRTTESRTTLILWG